MHLHYFKTVLLSVRLKYLQHSAWFLDDRTSTLVLKIYNSDNKLSLLIDQ